MKSKQLEGLAKEKKQVILNQDQCNKQHFVSFILAAAISYLLFCQSLLDFLVITDVINHRLGKLRLNLGQPGAKVTHVFVQQLHKFKCLLQFLHPMQTSKNTSLQRSAINGNDVSRR